MHTSIALLALVGFYVAPTGDSGPQWILDYADAQVRGQREGRPLAVFIAAGPAGYQQLAREGNFNGSVRRVLTEKYICVYVDANNRDGRTLADDFGIGRGPGLVISDRTGQVQAFSHQGTLSEEELERTLQRYADPNRMVQRTESNTVQRTSYYPPANGPTRRYAGPIWTGGGGRSC
jgi:hypothetical protein